MKDIPLRNQETTPYQDVSAKNVTWTFSGDNYVVLSARSHL